MQKYMKGQIWYYADPKIKVTYHSSAQGSVQSGSRPVIIVSNDTGNRHSTICMVVPLTSKDKTVLPTHFKFNIGDTVNTALCEQISTVAQSALVEYIGTLEDYEIDKLNSCMSIALNLVSTQKSAKISTKQIAQDKISSNDATRNTNEISQRKSYIQRTDEEKKAIIKAYEAYKNGTLENIAYILERHGFANEKMFVQAAKRWIEQLKEN